MVEGGGFVGAEGSPASLFAQPYSIIQAAHHPGCRITGIVPGRDQSAHSNIGLHASFGKQLRKTFPRERLQLLETMVCPQSLKPGRLKPAGSPSALHR